MKNKILLVLMVLCFVLFALGSGSSSDDKKPIVDENETTEKEEKKEEEKKKGNEASIEEGVILDYNGVTVTAKELTYDSIWGPQLKVLIENNSDQNLTITASAMAINGYMITDFFYEDVTPGNKVNSKFSCSSDKLKQAGINTIGEIDIWFRIYNSDNYKDIYVADEPVVIKTSEFDNMDSAIDVKGVEVVNQDNIRVIMSYVDENSLFGQSVLIYVENNSDNNILISGDNVSINGFMVTDLYSADAKAGYKSFDSLTILSSDLKENDITKIENIKMSFRCSNSDTYRTIFETEPVSVEVAQ